MTQFEMKIEEVFDFENGQTVFAGKVVEGPNFVGALQCAIEVDGTCVATIDLEGEMMPSGQDLTPVRSVSTRDSIDVDRSELVGATLRSILQ